MRRIPVAVAGAAMALAALAGCRGSAAATPPLPTTFSPAVSSSSAVPEAPAPTAVTTIVTPDSKVTP